MASRLVRIPVANGSITLEGALFSAAQSTHERTKLAVFCHPWSWLGGSMNDYVLHLLTPVFLQRQYTVLRFNSRGVGGSTGRTTLRGESEVTDLRDVVQWAVGELGGKVERLVLVGYSHGCLLTSRHPLLANVPTSHILISYPVSVLYLLTLFNSTPYRTALQTLAQDPASDVLAIYGDTDNFSGVTQFDKWADELKKEPKGKMQIEKVEGADHFWGGAGERLEVIIGKWLEER